jgi:RNA binding exosome subunit
MRKLSFLILFVFALSVPMSYAGFLDNIFKDIGGIRQGGPDNDTIISGLKEALSIGTDKAVKNVSQVDGYFGNKMIKILMPEKIQNVADVLSKVGYRKEVDDFILSMNRAAEKAGPQATAFFIDAIKDMSFDDAGKILKGGDTAATEFFRTKTHNKIYNAFKPIISSSIDEVGVTNSYKNMMAKYESIPFVDKQSLDLDHYG